MKNHERSIEHHQSQANPAPKQNLPKKSQILVKSIGPIWFWEYHGDGLDFEEMLIDVTAETASKEWEIKLVLDSRTQAEEFITKLRGALAQESEEATGTPTDPKDEDELHELN
jgi:hypothetical protein